MKYPDWKAYDERSLSPSELREAERLLVESMDARRDYAAFQEYRATLRQAALADSLPSRPLESLMPPVRKPLFGGRLLGLLAVGAAAISIGVLVQSQVRTPISKQEAVAAIGQIAHMDTNDPSAAAKWVQQNVSFQVPAYRLTGVANMTGAECGRNWGAYLYNCGKNKAKIILRPKGYQIPDSKPMTIGHTTFYVGKDSIGWNCPSLSYEIQGCTPEVRLSLAKAAASELFGSL